MKTHRFPLPLVLLVVVLVANVAGDPDATGAPRVEPPRDAVAVAPESALSTAWFCPGPPPTLAADSEVVVLTNVGRESQPAIVTVFPDDGSPPSTSEVDVEPAAVTSLARSSLGPAGGVVVEAFSRDVVVESGFASADLLATNPCASTSAPDWYFAAGTTVRGVEQFLVIFNPLGSDAKVDVRIRTGDGQLESESLDSLDIPRRSRVEVRVHERAVRTEQVAVDVNATVGRVVVEQTLVFGGDSTFTGTTRSLGALEPSERWTFADGTTTAGSTTMLALSNPGPVDAAVEVFATVGADAAVLPVEVTVAREGVSWVALGGCADPPPENCLPIPPDVAYSLAVETNTNTPVVAEVLAHYNGSASGSGSATLTGTAEPASRWIVPQVGAAGLTTVLAVANPNVRPVTVDVAVVRAGDVGRPADLQGIEIAANQRFGVDLRDAAGPGAALVVTASDPVVVERSLYGAGDASRAAMIPARDGT